MKQLLLNWLLKDIIRFEVINHTNGDYDIGRIIVHKQTRNVNLNYNFEFTSSLQDNDKTLKIFI